MIPNIDHKDVRNDTQPASEDPTSNAFASIVELNETEGKSYSDLTGRFPCKSDQGNLYDLVVYIYDDNAILVEPIKNRSEPEQIKAYTKILNRAKQGSTLKMHWMDNEASKGVKDLLVNTYKLTYQLVPPHIHRRNAAEVQKSFYRRIELIMNSPCACGIGYSHRPKSHSTSCDNRESIQKSRHKRPSTENSTSTKRHWRHRMQSTRTRKTGQRNSWDPHGAKGYYIGPATEHYRCFRTYVPKTQSERISDTVEFFPTGANTPIITPADAAIAAAEALRAAMLQSNQPVTIDLAEQTLQRLSDIFNGVSNTPTPTSVLPDEPPARVANLGPLTRVAEQTSLGGVAATLASRTRATNPTETNKDGVENIL
jgi:hypothetical protein